MLDQIWDTTEAPKVLLMNDLQVDEVLKVCYMDVGFTFIQKNGCAN